MKYMVVLHTYCNVVLCNHGHNFPFLFHAYTRVHIDNCSGTIDVPVAGTFVDVVVVVAIQRTMVHMVLHMLCGKVPFHTLAGLVGTVELMCIVEGGVVPMVCKCS